MDEQQQQKLKRSLKSRHVTMIAIGGAIGTGLFNKPDQRLSFRT